MNRSALVAGSIACFASAVFLWPAGVRSQLAVRPRERSFVAAARALPSVVAIAPDGDAFAPRVAIDDDPAPPRPTAPVPPSLHPVRPPALPEHGTVAATRVTAIATGTFPTAVIESGGVPRIVTAGDPLDGSTIAAIEDNAIRLADGRRLPLEQPGATH